jgi:hypothetical protein
MEDISGRVNFYKSFNWENQKFSNPNHKRNVSDLNLGAINKTSYKPDQQKSKFGLGIGKSRQLTEATYRPSPYGLCPSTIRPGSAVVFEYNGSTHSMGNVYDYNLQMNKLY